MPYSPRTLRARLLIGSSIAIAAILLGSSLLIYALVRASLYAEFDLALNSGVRAVSALTEQNARGIRLEPEAANIPEFKRKDAPDYYAVFVEPDHVVARSKSLGGGTLAHPTPPLNATLINNTILPDGSPGRQITLTFAPVFEDAKGNSTPGGRIVTVTVARHTAALERNVARLAWLLAAVGSIATLGAALSMLLVIRRGLRPLSLLASRLAAMRDDHLTRRIELADTPAELSIVVERLNELLERLRTTLERERGFTADAAHELRTPLSGLEAILDVCAARPRAPAEYVQVLAKCHGIVRGMHSMVDGLMTLARADSRQLAAHPVPVSLASLVEECWLAQQDAAAAKSARVSFELDRQLVIQTDIELLRMVLNNLFNNAVGYCDAGGWIRIEARSDGPEAELSVSNSGSTLTEDQARRAFDRFWRGDDSRRQTGLHCGLGLSLCLEIASVLGGRITAGAEPGGVFHVRLTLPSRSGASSPGAPRNGATETAAQLQSITG